MAIKSTHIAPGPGLIPLQTNYMSKYDFANKYQPALLDRVVELYGKGLVGFTMMFGKEIPMSADRIYWAEDGRLRKLEKNVSLASDTGTFTCSEDTVQRVGAKILVMDPNTGKKQVARVESLSADNKKVFTAKPYDASWVVGTSGLNVMTIGSEFKKGSGPMNGSLANKQTIYNTSLTISKDTHAMNDSDLCNIAWLEAPDGSKFWYHQELEDFFTRFDDYEELNMLLSTKIAEASPLFSDGYNSTSGLFESIRVRGGNMNGMIQQMTDVVDIIKYMDKEQGEKSNAIFCTTDQYLAIENMIAEFSNTVGTPGWGYFDNKDRAVKFGFNAFERAGYEFYMKKWETINDITGLSPENTGAAGAVNGIIMPMGTIRVPSGYNDNLAGVQANPINYLNLLYKAGDGMDRRRRVTFYGQKVQNGREDITGVDITSERGLMLVGASKWMIVEGE